MGTRSLDRHQRLNKLVFWISSFQTIPVQIVGTIRLSELAAFLVIPSQWHLVVNSLRIPTVKLIVALGAIWLSSQTLSNMVNDVSPYNMARGCANIAVLLTSFVVFSSIYSFSPDSHGHFLKGAVVAGLIGIFLPATSGDFQFKADQQLWDRYVTSWGLPAFAWFAARNLHSNPRRILTTGTLYGIAAIAFGGRSNGLIALVGTVLLGYVSHLRRLPPTMRRIPSLLKLGTIGTILLFPAFFSYVELGLRGELGALTQRQLVGLPNPYNPLYVVSAARIESLVSLHAIRDKPWLGHGSWAYDPKYDILYQTLNRRITGDGRPYANNHRVIPSHSVIFGSWMFGGIAGFIFWAVAFVLIIQRSRLLMLYGNDLAQAVACVFLAYTLWHLFFSPMGYARYSWPANMAFLLTAKTGCSPSTSSGRTEPSPWQMGRS